MTDPRLAHALANPPGPRHAQALSITPEALKQGAAALRDDLQFIKTSLRVDTPALFQTVGALLIEQLRVLDSMQEQRDAVTKPLYEGWKNTCELFKEGLDLQKEICASLKGLIAGYELEQARLKALATQEARAALVTGDVQTIERALTVVNEAAPDAAQGVSTTFKWQVKRLAPVDLPCSCCGSVRGMVPREYWTEQADFSKLNDFASRWKENDPPIIPGVIFERAASVTGRRK